jgi:hypothetical protein
MKNLDKNSNVLLQQLWQSTLDIYIISSPSSLNFVIIRASGRAVMHR